MNEADTEADKRGPVSSERQREKPQVLISQVASLSEAWPFASLVLPVHEIACHILQYPSFK